MSLLRSLLLPISLFYYLFQIIRNKLYEWNLLKSKYFNIPTISVGNLSVGGTGKTPLVNYIISNFKNNYKIAFLSRGYGRSSSGYILATKNTVVNEIGDEPYLIKKNHNEIVVSVSEDRVHGIEKTIEKIKDIQMFVLDDAFQHRKLKCKLNIILSKFSKPYYNDFVIPSGSLREPKSGAKRAQIIIISKCPPDLNKANRQEIIRKIKPLPHQKVFFTTIDYDEYLVGKNNIMINDLKDSPVLLVTGIADSSELEKYLNKKKIIFDHLRFDDHHNYSQNDINLIKSKSIGKKVITTKKDYYKIIAVESIKNIYCIDIAIKFLSGKDDFNDEISRVIR